MPTEKVPVNYRISKSSGRSMIFVALLFDLLPFLTVVGVAVLAMYGVGHFVGMANGCSGILCKIQTILTVVKGVAMGASGIGVIILAGPFVYSLGSWISTPIAFVSFRLWFGAKKVNIWKWDSFSKLATNILTFIVEMIPVADLLPGTTFMVWRHIKISRAEDKIKHNKAIEAVNRLPRRSRMVPRRPLGAYQ